MDESLLEIGADSLRKAALNEEAKSFILNNAALFKVLRKAANRYLGGETLPEAAARIQSLNDRGFSVTTDYMGESVRSEIEAQCATNEFVRLAKTIKEKGLNSSLSLDLSHIGLLISKDLATKNLRTICQHARKAGQEVIISMEGVDRTDSILDVYRAVSDSYENLGITLQAYLKRTKDDFKELSKLPGSIRIVKGAYETPAGLSIERGEALDELYLDYVAQLLATNHKCAIASHHEKMHQEATKLVDKYGSTRYVLERLLGIRNETLDSYKEQGYHCRIYVVFGKEWYLYLCNRWAEYPLSVFQGIADVIEDSA